MKHLVVTAILLASVVQLTAQTGTETINNAKVNLISGNGTSLFQSQSTSGIWGTGMVVGDRWGVFEDATSAKERLSILPGGNVGVGTSSPSNKLTVTGSVGNTPSILVRNTSYSSTNTTGTAALQFAFANHIGPKIEASKFTRNYTGLKFYTELGYNLPQLAMTLAPTNTGANVGIGTSSPSNKLTVTGSVGNTPSILVRNTSYNSTSTSGTAALQFAFANHIGPKIEASKFTRNYTGLKFYTELGYNLPQLAMTLAPTNTGANVGIGTDSPSNKLTVTGSVGNTPSILVRNTSYSATNTTGTAALQFAFSNHIGPKIEASKFTRNHTGLKFYTELGYNLPQLAMTLAPTNTGTNVGIGTSNPTEKLEVYGGGNLLLRGANNNAGDILFQTNSKKQTGRIWTAGTGSSGLYMSSGDLIPDFSIDNNGNVGIGTLNTSAYKLSVDGNVRATEVKVYTGWADYVFAKDYKLPTLEKVAQHIEEKGHLINIPSAKEVEKDGILLGAMNAKLLEKIEELTLYTLEQEKQLKAQEKELNHQKIKNNSLEERLEKIEFLLQDK